MFEPITKRTKMVVRPDTIGEIVRLAFKYAENEKPGATHIDLPVNIAKMPVPEHEKPLKKKIAPKEYAELDTVQDAAGLIFQRKICHLSRSGVVRGHAAQALTEFAMKLKIPVINTMMAKGVIHWITNIPCGPSESRRKIIRTRSWRKQIWSSPSAMTSWNMPRPNEPGRQSPDHPCRHAPGSHQQAVPARSRSSR